MYESIIACRDNLRRRGRYWLRLYDAPEGAVAVVGEVRGNIGPSITNAAEHVALALVERFDLDPEQLTLVEHYPPDSLNRDRKGTLDLMKLLWLREQYARPKWTPLTLNDVAQLVGFPLAGSRPFWRESAGSYRCRVGRRGATVSQLAGDTWRAVITLDGLLVVDGRQTLRAGGFPEPQEAMCWALDALANLAAEFDTYPYETNSMSRE